MRRFSLLPQLLAGPVVAASLFLLPASVAEAHDGCCELKQHEVWLNLIGGTLVGGSVGGAIAAWLFLKFDLNMNDQIEIVGRRIRNVKEDLDHFHDKLQKELDAKSQEKMASNADKLEHKVNMIIQEINKLQSSIDELKDPTS